MALNHTDRIAVFCRWMGKGRVFRFLIGITDFVSSAETGRYAICSTDS